MLRSSSCVAAASIFLFSCSSTPSPNQLGAENGSPSGGGSAAVGGAVAGGTGGAGAGNDGIGNKAGGSTADSANVSGLPWSDPTTWGGNVPDADTAVVIPEGKTITLDQNACVKSLKIMGVLNFADADLELCAQTIMVHGGRLIVGSENKPFTKHATITLLGSGPLPLSDDLPAGTKSIVVMDGGQLDLHGVPQSTPWTKLAVGAKKGDATIEVLDASGWQVGDEIVIASGSIEPNQAEVRKIAAISAATLTLDQPLTNDHLGDVQMIEGRTLDMRVEVGRLTRNIVIQGDKDSEARNGFGGHVMIMAGGKAYVDGIELLHMGQFDNLGRYPFHWHLVGDAAGQYLKNSVVNGSLQRGIVVHSTNQVTVEGNIVYNSRGHNLMVETPETADNLFKNNLMLVNRQAIFTQETLATQHDEQPSNYWLRSAKNTFIGNHAAGTEANGFWYDATDNGPTVFQDNTAHSSARRGKSDFVRDSGLQVFKVDTASVLEFSNTTLFHNMTSLWPAENATQTYKGFIFGEPGLGAGSHIVPETVGADVTIADALFVGSMQSPGDNVQPAIGVQYGSRVYLENPVFYNFGKSPVLSSNDIANPWFADFTIQGARFVNTDPQASSIPDGIAYATDDTYLPRGFYVHSDYPELAAPDMKLVQIREDSFFFGPQRYPLGLIQLGSASAAIENLSFNIKRSDGLTYAAASGFGFRVIAGAGYEYELLGVPGSGDFHIGHDLPDDATLTVAVPLGNAPRGVQRMVNARQLPADEEDMTTPVLAAASRGEFQANAANSYFYDAGTGLLSLGLTNHWIKIQR